VLPSPGTDSTVTSPPMRSANLCTVARPTPVPGSRATVAARSREIIQRSLCRKLNWCRGGTIKRCALNGPQPISRSRSGASLHDAPRSEAIHQRTFGATFFFSLSGTFNYGWGPERVGPWPSFTPADNRAKLNEQSFREFAKAPAHGRRRTVGHPGVGCGNVPRARPFPGGVADGTRAVG
jgi:hypothetical protein